MAERRQKEGMSFTIRSVTFRFDGADDPVAYFNIPQRIGRPAC